MISRAKASSPIPNRSETESQADSVAAAAKKISTNEDGAPKATQRKKITEELNDN